MVEALRHFMPDGVVENIDAFIPRRPEIEWEAVYGSTTIYGTQHFITHGGGLEGGYVYFRERPAGWYRWERSWGTPPTYTKLGGVLIQRFEDNQEYVAHVSEDFCVDSDDEDAPLGRHGHHNLRQRVDGKGRLENSQQFL